MSFAGGTVITFAFGLVWLAIALGTDLPTTLEYGLYPFVIGGVVKAALGAGVVVAAWQFVGRYRK